MMIISISAHLIRGEKEDLKHLTPSHTTVSIWTKKIGHYQIQKTKEKANDWILILDHSIQVGQEKLLVIYGIRENQISFKRALQFTDLTILRLISKTKWNGEIMHEILKELKEELGKILYATGDYGSDIRKGLQLSNIIHIHDITHKIAIIVKKVYENDKKYIGLTKQISKKRQQWNLSQYAHLLPPKLRNKSRYQNIQTISDWGRKMLKYYQKIKKKETEKSEIFFITKYEKFIEELAQINEQINKIEKLIKTNGLNKKTAEKSLQYISEVTEDKAAIVKEELKKYFEEFLDLLPNRQTILATSDIIESAFGKYKNYLSSNYMTGITDLALCIAAFTSPLTAEEIKEALKNTHMKDLKNWASKNIGVTLLKRRRNAFSIA